MTKTARTSTWTLALALSVVAWSTTGALASERRGAPMYRNPVVAGDHPDPSVVRVGNDFYATATTSEWEPEFPILHSRDLVNWEPIGAVFLTRPAWAVGNFWAPEISYRDGTFFVYYVARKAGAGLCVAVATASRAAGPWTDYGPLVGQEDGSIDPMTVDDENGRRYLVWKEDGNSKKRPTPIWAQPLARDGLKLEGEPKELFRNDAEWEAQLVEGPYVLRRRGYFYVFYSGNACCGSGCDYSVGVARSKSLLGPYQKCPANPILDSTDEWRCPGHGSVVSANGRDYFLYHAYRARFGAFVGREALLDEIAWGKDGWPTVNGGRGPSVDAKSPLGASTRRAESDVVMRFAGARRADGFQWPQGHEPAVSFDKRFLELSPGSGAEEGVLAWPTEAVDYEATATVAAFGDTGLASLSAYGDAENALGIGLRGDDVVVWRRVKNVTEILVTASAYGLPRVSFRMAATEGRLYRFAFWNGNDWEDIGKEVEGAYLPPWDRGVRVALVSTGASAVSRFSTFAVKARPTTHS